MPARAHTSMRPARMGNYTCLTDIATRVFGSTPGPASTQNAHLTNLGQWTVKNSKTTQEEEKHHTNSVNENEIEKSKGFIYKFWKIRKKSINEHKRKLNSRSEYKREENMRGADLLGNIF